MSAGNVAPTVSVIIPVFNGSLFIAEALDSIWAQAYEPIDVICVDDGSTDDTIAILEQMRNPRLRIIQQAHLGVATARNTGVRAATGDFVAFLDADDWWPPNRLHRQLAVFAAEPALQSVVGLMEWVFTKSARTDGIVFREMAQQSVTTSLCVGLFRRTAFEQVGLFDTSLWAGEDVDWYQRHKELRVPMRMIDDTLLYYRRHGNNMTNDARRVTGALMRVLKLSLDRRRVGRAPTETAYPLPTLSSFK